MIAFDLECICGCRFEGWFLSRNDFERQNDADQITCPHCGSERIHKILSPVAIHSGSGNLKPSVPNENDQQVTKKMAVQFLQSVQNFVEKNFDNVGPKLAEESLKMHYGVTEPRNIYGIATKEEEKMLTKEGIELLKVPLVNKKPDPDVN